MLTLLIRLYGPRDHGGSADSRRQLGRLSSALGILLNALLFAAKLTAGFLSGSIAIIADAFNSLSDAATSLVTMIGFTLSGKQPDERHPFGHGRLEYVSGLIVSLLIVAMGLSLLKSSVQQITDPQETQFSPVTAAILALSVGVKLYMFMYNRALGRRIESPALIAASRDSLGDLFATSIVLLSVASAFYGVRLGSAGAVPVDGIGGIAVSSLIVYSGLSSAREAISPLIGEAPSGETVDAITAAVRSAGCVLGVHDLEIHDYGPGRRVVTLHAEVPADGDWLAMHDEIDALERRLASEFQCSATIHMDPVTVDDPGLSQMREDVVRTIAARIDPRLTVHDFRVVESRHGGKLLFDVLAPYDLAMSDDEIRAAVRECVRACAPCCRAVVRVDRG